MIGKALRRGGECKVNQFVKDITVRGFLPNGGAVSSVFLRRDHAGKKLAFNNPQIGDHCVCTEIDLTDIYHIFRNVKLSGGKVHFSVKFGLGSDDIIVNSVTVRKLHREIAVIIKASVLILIYFHLRLVTVVPEI